MAVMLDFIRHGQYHWLHNGESPCGVRPYPRNAVYAVLEACGYREIVPAHPEPCPTCIPTRDAYIKFMRNGGCWIGPWDIRPNEDRPLTPGPGLREGD